MSNLLGDLPEKLFSPFKMFYMAYIILAYFKVGNVDWCQFAFVSFIFLMGEILHNDFFRIKLNHWACNICQCGK